MARQKVKRLRKNRYRSAQILGGDGYDSDKENESPTPPTNDAPSTSSPNTDPTTTPANNSTSASTITVDENPVGRRRKSDVWRYATKTDDGETAKCQLCDFTCKTPLHSTTHIR
ncbi:unnamed protein product [Didymodactylos carnosus]|uniref:BED-type domain-containing protein n=1 Tax=Didymodactylos carnosus TaxID=1234261 RepID=A0A814BS87_9BILA|nr:unnamed protein product [Didymodactylos carnosus]CAF1610380.1 unnamed protein product [Didymodactylos carnosus]CAF3708668.1 unnamed protein product [Didymodactylos carnosus]CAF4423871.1 unnamed protein product [Didymodactylos carnosus]